MTKEEFKKVLTMFISGKHDLKYGEIMPGNFDKLLDDVISEAIAEHEAKQWKKGNRPDKSNDYLIRFEDGQIDLDHWNNDRCFWHGPGSHAIAFRELPKPYQEGGER